MSVCGDDHEQRMESVLQEWQKRFQSKDPIPFPEAEQVISEWGVDLLEEKLGEGLDSCRKKQIVPRRRFSTLYSVGLRFSSRS